MAGCLRWNGWRRRLRKRGCVPIFVTRASPRWRSNSGFCGEVPNSGGVYLVPAFTGLGAPYWDPDARAAIIGLTRASTRNEIARATLDCVAYQTFDLLDAMAADGLRPSALKVDGGMSRNDLFMQRLADILGITISRPENAESTAFGAACLAGR